MDPKEFNLIYDKESPLLRESIIGNIVKKILEEEKVPHSAAPSSYFKQAAPFTDFKQAAVSCSDVKQVVSCSSFKQAVASSDVKQAVPSRDFNFKQAAPSREFKQAAPCRDVKQAVPSRDFKQAAPSRDFKQAAPSRDFKQAAPSCDVKQATPSRDFKQATPSSDFKQAALSSDAKQAGPSRDFKQAALSSNAKQAAPSRDFKQAAPSCDVKQATPSRDFKQATPSSDFKQAALSSDVKQAGPSSDLKQGHILDRKYQATITHDKQQSISKRNSELFTRKRFTQNDSSINENIKQQCLKQNTTFFNKNSAQLCATRFGTISSSSFACSSRDLALTSRQSPSHPNKTTLSVSTISDNCSQKESLSEQIGIISSYKDNQPSFPEAKFGEDCFKRTNPDGTCAYQRKESATTSTCRPVEELRSSRSKVDTDYGISESVVQRSGATDCKEDKEMAVHCDVVDEVTENPDINNEESGNIIPVEIGRVDKNEMTRMIENLVNANTVFKEFPRKNEPAKITLVQKQNSYLENKQREGTELRPEHDKQNVRSKVLEASVKYIEMRIAESVRFAKKIPQFLDLPLEDQANLIRESRTESGIVGGMRGINAEKRVFSSLNGSFFSMEDMKLVFDEKLLYETILLSKKIASLNMSVEEEAILRAMTITATDRCKLLRRDIVEDIQNKLMSCLLHVISAGSRPVSQRLCKLFDVLRDCRYITEVEMEQVKKIFLEWPSFSNYKLAEEFL